MNNRSELLAFIHADEHLARIYDEVRRRAQDDPAHDVAHSLRVALWTIRIAGSCVPVRSCIAAALLHDVVNAPKGSPDRHRASEMSAAEARRLLSGCHFQPADEEDICGAIRDHSYSRGARPESVLGQALQDADRLEALGVIGVFRAIATGGIMGARFFDSADPWALRRALDDRSYSVDHFFTKLFRLPSLMNTEQGRAEAERRAARMRETLRWLGEELEERMPAREGATEIS